MTEAETLVTLLPENPDLTVVPTISLLGAVVFGTVARISRRLGGDTDVYERTVDGAFLGALAGILLVFFEQIGG